MPVRFVWKSVEVGRFGRQQHQQRPEDSHGTRLKHRDKLADSTTNQQILPRIYTLQHPSVGSTCSEMSNMRTSNPPQSQMQKTILHWHKKCMIQQAAVWEARLRPTIQAIPYRRTLPAPVLSVARDGLFRYEFPEGSLQTQPGNLPVRRSQRPLASPRMSPDWPPVLPARHRSLCNAETRV